jgi:alpha-galactosidase
MSRRVIFWTAVFATVLSAATLNHAQILAPTPPMGWNSWDAYGLTIDEADFKANVTVLAGLKEYGWQYAVIDEGWYMEDPFGKDVEQRKYLWDGNGVLIPVTSRFPTAAGGAGFKPLADWVHAQGLKFGIHIVRGIPRGVVKENLPIAGTSFHAVDAADTSSPCPWDQGNWGVKDNAAGQAYYDDMLMKYARWGLDFIKVDCISDRPYRPSEIKQVTEAIRKTGRPIVLSLSPGPTAVENAAEVAKYSQMWRISDDHWDVWNAEHKAGDGEFPFGIGDAFDRLAKWEPYAKPGNWPDGDMLPFGWLGPHPGWGKARQSRLTQDEERTEFTLWAIARSPLILGANLTRLDAFTRGLITNREVLALSQKTRDNHDLKDLPAGFERARVWESSQGAEMEIKCFALFNLDNKPVTLHFTWGQFGVRGNKEAQNLWDGRKLKSSEAVEFTLPAHGSTVYRVQ